LETGLKETKGAKKERRKKELNKVDKLVSISNSVGRVPVNGVFWI